jgi:hypothetical protein
MNALHRLNAVWYIDDRGSRESCEFINATIGTEKGEANLCVLENRHVGFVVAFQEFEVQFDGLLARQNPPNHIPAFRVHLERC